MACVSTMQCLDLCCIPLYCCDTTPTSSTSFSINLTWKAACLCPFMGVLWMVLKVELCVTDTGGDQPTPLLQYKDSPFGPSARIEHPWTTAVTPWEKRPVAPVANWSASSRTNSNKEILVTLNIWFLEAQEIDFYRMKEVGYRFPLTAGTYLYDSIQIYFWK